MAAAPSARTMVSSSDRTSRLRPRASCSHCVVGAFQELESEEQNALSRGWPLEER